jgi:glutamate-5-semialdehyde dehydrogenase
MTSNRLPSFDPAQIQAQLEQVRAGAAQLRKAGTEEKNSVLGALRDWLGKNVGALLAANQRDLERAEGVTQAFKDRLTLTEKRIDSMRLSLEQVQRLADPVGEVAEQRVLANGLAVERVRAPLGVIYMIYESRPNVAIEAFGMALKSGNGLILRGGKESQETVALLYSGIRETLQQSEFNSLPFLGITDPDRELSKWLLKQRRWIDVVVPRGGDQLIEFVTSNSQIPMIKNDRGLCHTYLHQGAHFGMAEQLVENAKTQRPGVCNALETLLVDRAIAENILPRVYDRLASHSVKWWGCQETLRILKGRPAVLPATQESFDREYLDLELSCKVVEGFEEALAHIQRHGSGHSEVIVTEDQEMAERFLTEVDAAATYWNASSRFTDGMELGLGGELGISTQKLHVRGPVGLRELTSLRWLIRGKGQIREG